jgi:hypothetical protein
MNYEVGDLVRSRLDRQIGIVVSTKIPHVNKGLRVQWTQTGERRNYYKGNQWQLEKLCK